jgi:hypothetical protein
MRCKKGEKSHSKEGKEKSGGGRGSYYKMLTVDRSID